MLNLDALLLISFFLIAVPSTSGFVAFGRPSIDYLARGATITTNPPRRYDHSLVSSPTTSTLISPFSLYAITTNSSRRNFLEQSLVAIPFIITPQAAIAKKEQVESAAAAVTTRQTVSDAFDAIRIELSSPSGLISTLTNLINNNSYPEIMQYTKESDAYFRKAKLGKARKLLTDGALKNDAILMSNAVTFDLIGINRASRPGRENREEQMKYLEELRKDIERFLELESTIVVGEE